MIALCVIKDNQAPHGQGGGICCRGGAPVITHCIISNNSTAPYGKGGGIYSWSSSPEIRNCLIIDNASNGYGGGIYCNREAPFMNLCTIVGNSALYMGGGICTYGTDSASGVGNSIIWGNTAPDGPSIKLRDTSYPTVSYSDVQGGFAGTGNINADPCFANPSSDNYHLLLNSRCINTGDPNYYPGTGEKDSDNESRMINARVDMGVDEVNYEGPLVGVSPTVLNFSAQLGAGNPEAQILSVTNMGTGVLTWAILQDCNWLTVEPNSGESTGESNAVSISVNISGLPLGRYICKLTIVGPNEAKCADLALMIYEVEEYIHVPEHYPTIQTAINAAQEGYTVIVADGVYTGDGNRDIDFLGKAITVRSENGPTNCIIECNGSPNEPHQGFTFQSGEGPNSILTGFTVTGGYSNDKYWQLINCGLNCRPRIINCIFRENSSGVFGGRGGTAAPGPELVNCTFYDNSGREGVGIVVSYYTPHEDEAAITLNNCILPRNEPEEFSYIDCCMCGCGHISVNYSILESDWENTAWTWSHNIITVDPCFADPCNVDFHFKSQRGRCDPNCGSLVIDATTSLCIDAGDPNSDWTAELWPHGKRINCGAYGGTPQASMSLSDVGNIADLDNDDDVDYADMGLLGAEWLSLEVLLRENLDRKGPVDACDFAVFAENWRWEQ
jgi:hypothetical protein